MRWTLPNILTLARLFAAPAVALLFALASRPFADWAALTLFLTAAATDWIDGRLARRWGQITRIGTMLDPIADKAMVVIALLVLAAASSLGPWLIVPAALILFREVFVSGLREYLGDTGGTLRVTALAKWKTTVQMLAIAVLFAHGVFEHYFAIDAWGMDAQLVDEILQGTTEDLGHLHLSYRGMLGAGWAGLGLIWIAALLTLVTGWDYFRKALPHLKETA